MSYTQVVFAFALQIVVLREWPNFWSFIGAGIVLLCSVLMAIKQWLRNRRNTTTTTQKLQEIGESARNNDEDMEKRIN